MKDHIAITGTTGFIGRHIVRELKERNIPFHLCVRHPRQRDTRNDIVFNLENPEQLNEESLRDVKCVIHCAAMVHQKARPSRNTDLNFDRLNFEATETLIKKSVQSGVKHFILISTVAVYGTSSAKSRIRDSTPVRPITAYGASKLKAELFLIDYLRNREMKYTIIRLPLVYGPNAPGNFGAIEKLAASGIPLPFAGTNNSRTIVSVENAADFITFAIGNEALQNKTILFSDGGEFSTREIISSLRTAMGQSPLMFYFPAPFMKLALMAIGKKNIYRQIYENLLFECSDSVRESGWVPPHSPDIGRFVRA